MTYEAGDALTAQWGKRIRVLRERANVTPADFAEMIDCHKSTLSRIENGKQRPSDELRVRIAQALGTPIGRIFTYDLKPAK